MLLLGCMLGTCVEAQLMLQVFISISCLLLIKGKIDVSIAHRNSVFLNSASCNVLFATRLLYLVKSAVFSYHSVKLGTSSIVIRLL